MPVAVRTYETEVAVVGSGLAGLVAALEAGRGGGGARGAVTLIARDALTASNSAYAQGGIAAAVDPADDPAAHAEDTLRAGRGLAWPAAVRVLVEEGPCRVQDLSAWGVAFDRRADGTLDLGLEGGHGRRRVLHAGGVATGAAVVSALGRAVSQAAGIEVWAGARAVGLVSDGGRCYGLLVRRGGELWQVRARATILATGGLAGLYGRTTNPPGARGEGIALAYLAGADVADLEFVQFHPTALVDGPGPALLLSEALRGEGAVVRNARGERFLARYEPRGELAPRDAVAGAIWREMRATGTDRVYLTLEGVAAAALPKFAPLAAALRAYGIDMARDPIPVAPAAHYTIGGVRTDLHGRTSLLGLYACGEVACTGVHGANRLASNSLLECAVFGARAARAALDDPPGGDPPGRGEILPLWAEGGGDPPEDPPDLGRLLLEGAGIERTADGLDRLRQQLRAHPESPGVVVARLLTEAALLREESRGAHRRIDFPVEADGWRRHIVWRRGQGPRLEVWE